MIKYLSWGYCFVYMFIITLIGSFVLFDAGSWCIFFYELLLLVFILLICFTKNLHYKKLDMNCMLLSSILIVITSIIRFLFVCLLVPMYWYDKYSMIRDLFACLGITEFNLYHASDTLYTLLIISFCLPIVVLILVLIEKKEKIQERIALLLFSILLVINCFIMLILKKIA